MDLCWHLSISLLGLVRGNPRELWELGVRVQKPRDNLGVHCLPMPTLTQDKPSLLALLNLLRWKGKERKARPEALSSLAGESTPFLAHGAAEAACLMVQRGSQHKGVLLQGDF